MQGSLKWLKPARRGAARAGRRLGCCALTPPCPAAWPRTWSTSRGCCAARACRWAPTACSARAGSAGRSRGPGAASTDFHAVLRACLLDRIEHAELFDQAFALFWKRPRPDRAACARCCCPRCRCSPACCPARRRTGAWATPSSRTQPQPTTRPDPPPEGGDRVRRRADGQRPGAAAPGRLRHHDGRRMARRQAPPARAACGPVFERLRDAPLRSRPPARAAPTGAPRLRESARRGGELLQPHWRQRAHGSRCRWWCWPTCQAR